MRQGFEEGERHAQETARRIEARIAESGEKGFGKFTEAAAKTLVVMGTIELGVKAIDAISAAAAGEWEKVDQVMASLPAGIGPVYSAMKSLIDSGGEYLGIWQSIATIQKEIEERTKIQDATQQAINAGQDFGRKSEDLQFEARLSGIEDPFQRERVALERERERAIEEARNEAQAAGRFVSNEEEQAAVDAINAIYDARREEISKRQGEEAAAFMAAQDAKVAAIQEAAAREAAESEKAAMAVANAQAKEAEKAADQFAKAAEEQDRESERRLKILQDKLESNTPKLDETERAQNADFEQVALSRIAIGGPEGLRSVSDKELPEQTKLLRSINDGIRRGAPAVAA
jgi:hypothetical protein